MNWKNRRSQNEASTNKRVEKIQERMRYRDSVKRPDTGLIVVPERKRKWDRSTIRRDH